MNDWEADCRPPPGSSATRAWVPHGHAHPPSRGRESGCTARGSRRPGASSFLLFTITCALILGVCSAARAEPIELPIYYSTNTSPPALKSATLTYDPAPLSPTNVPLPPAAAVSSPVLLATLTKGYAGATPGPADGLALGPDGAFYIASAPSNLHRVVTSPALKVTYSTVSLVDVVAPAATPPAPLGSLRLDSNLTTLWALSRGAAVPPLSPAPQGALARASVAASLQPGVAAGLIGDDGIIHDLCSISGRTYYVGPGLTPGSGTSGAPGAGALGLLDPITLRTTRLLSPLPAAAGSAADPSARTSSLACDALTGDLIVFGGDRVTQVSISGASPVIAAEKPLTSLAGVGAGARVRAGTLDGRGRLIALLSTGQIVLIDYSESRSVAAATNVVRVLTLDAAAANLLPLSGPGAVRTSEKLWDNGAFDGRNGQLSVQGPLSGDARTADDFALEPDAIYRLDRVRAVMFSNAPRPKARIDVYDDCNGKPGTLLGSYAATLTPTGAAFSGFTVYTVDAPTPNLWVDAGRGGRTLWISPVGVGDANFADQWYFATTRQQEIIGSAGAFKSATFGYPDWIGVSGLPCGCSDFAFRVEGQRCETLFNNGEPPLVPAVPLGASVLSSGLLSSAQVADDFAVSLQSDVLVCALAAVVYTNCDPVLGGFDLYATRCSTADGAPLLSVPFSRAVDLGYDVQLDGRTLRAYRVEAFDLAWYLHGDRNYALSVRLTGSGSLNQRGVWAYADNCAAPGCAIRFSEASARVASGAVGTPTAWRPISQTSLSPGVPRAMNFHIAGRRVHRACSGDSSGSSGNGGAACIADFDHNGEVTVNDLFSFLEAWFSGCP